GWPAGTWSELATDAVSAAEVRRATWMFGSSDGVRHSRRAPERREKPFTAWRWATWPAAPAPLSRPASAGLPARLWLAPSARLGPRACRCALTPPRPAMPGGVLWPGPSLRAFP